MKDTNKKYLGFIVIIVILVVIIGILRNNSSTAPQTASSGVPVQSPAQAAKSVTTSSARSPATYTAPRTTPLSTGSYVDYLTALRNNQNNCKNAAAAQTSQLYPSLLSSSITSYYNSANGLCYVEVIGVTRQAYSTTTTGHIYFRNVSRNALLAECTDPTGTMYADGNWDCVDKTSGQTIVKAQFNALVGSDTTQ